ncbi:MAG: hemagglutinin repeat-containing protein [Aquabacterium sp.]|jgi:filamentous hemagglutinin family protein|uniref:hemagglutinin repeat-containing protein n=1 Tax=Aquabacterium sp. TaxID=1872578 RepID=UPI003BB0DF01
MNRSYRHVWNKAQGRFVVAAENASSRGQGAGRARRSVIATAAVGAVVGWAAVPAYAQITVANGKTEVFRASNGVQVVNIETANQAGLSHNKFLNYNVEKTGVVLNNGNSDQMARQSQLAGQVAANLNLGAEARVILNEVVGNSRSMLQGFTEVLGGKADVVVANPYGITCSGCGFINTDRAVLTTGLPQIGSGGTLDGFRVMQGDILIDGAGIDASSTRLLDLVARSIKVDGRLVGADVGITTGSNDFTWATRSATPIVAGNAAPSFAFDSTVLGGMYANRIAIVATEAGVGVRMLGEVAATADDFVVSAAGKIEINTRISAERDLKLASTVGATAISIEGAETQLSSKRDLVLLASLGAVALDESTFSAGRDLTLTASSLTDTSTTAKQRYAGGDVAITTTGATQITGSAWGAGDDLSVSASSLAVGQGKLYSGADAQATGKSLSLTTTGGAMTLNQTSVQSTGTLDLDSASSITTNGTTEIRATGDYSVTAAGAITHAGKLLGAAKGDIQAGTTVTNSNVIHAADDLEVRANLIDNTATAGLSSLKQLTLTATNNINNRGALYAGEHMLLKGTGANGAIRNYSTGTIDSSGTLTTNSADFTNNGAVVSVGDMLIKATRSFVNETIWAGGSLTKRDGSVNYGSLISEDKIADEGSFDNGMNAWLVDESFNYDEELVGLTLSQLQGLQKAQIIANGATSKLTIDYGPSGLNRVGVISAPNVEIKGTGTFRNEELALYNVQKTLRWIRIEDESSGDDDFTAWARVDPDTYCYIGAPAGCVGRDDGLPNSPDDDYWNWDDWNPGPGWVKTRNLSGDSFPGVLADEARALAVQGSLLRDATVIGRSGAGIFATNLTFTGGTVENVGSPWKDDATRIRQSTLQNTTVNAPNQNTSVTLPSNPNGYYVPSKDPSAKFLVETNPIFAVGSDFVGSDYMAQRFGFNPDTVQTRLGDANYEAYLIRQQLIEKTGSNVIAGYNNEADQMKRLMDQAVTQGGKLGLEFGKTPTPEQLAGLTEDIVWMEEVVVNGQKVLAPKVYLAASTVAAIDTGAVIGGQNVTIAGEGLKNTGGTIAGTGTLNVKTTGDITNTSGTIKGGDVNLTSTGGSIRNETTAIGAGDGTTYNTAIGKTAGIQSTGNLNLDAAKNIEVIGADVTAKGDASLSAGGNITVDTIVDKTTSTSYSESGGFLSSSSTRTTTGTETNIGSNLNTGGNLKIKSGGDTTIAGSNANVGGNLDAETGGSLNVIARQDKAFTQTESTTSGLGVGGGLAGTSTTTKDVFDGTNKGSTLNVGGNANIKSADTVTIQGSDVKISGNADIDATKGIQVLDGLDEYRETTKTVTTTFMKVGGETAAEANAKAQNGAGRSAEAGASASANGSLKLAETTTTTTQSGSNTSVASNLSVGGNLNMKSEGTVTVQGSNVEAGGNLNVDAKNIEVLSGRNETWSNSQTESTSIGIYSENNAEAGANAKQTGASASASASASADSTTTLGVQTQSAESSEYSLKNSASSLKSGGNMNLNAKEEAKFVGANVESGGDMSIKAKDITSMAAQDIETSSSSSTTRTAGVYVGGNASADASASSNGTASASASAEVSAGLRYADKSESSDSGSVTQQTSSFKSGGNITREAQGTITDQGTQIEAAGNIKQSATTIKEVAAENSSYSNSGSSSNDARVGVYAGAGAGADSRTGNAGADASAGFKASYAGSTASESESSTSTVTSRYKAGGSIDSTSTDKTTLIGTQFEAGKDVNITAGSLDYQAAKDTTSSSSSSLSGSVEAKVGVVGTAGVNGSAELDAEKSKSQSTTSNAGGINAGGSINIKTKGDATFEGTNMSAKDAANVDAGGNVTFNAARDTSSESSQGVSASISAGTSGSGSSRESEGAGSLGVSASGASSDTAKASNIQAGSGGVTIKSGGNTALEGTQVQTSGTASVTAGGQVKAVDAKSSSSSYGVDASIAGGASSGEGGKSKGSGGASLGVEGSASSSSQSVNIQSGVPVKP